MTQSPAPPSPRLVLLGGFLGAGKTTTIVRLAGHWAGRGRRVVVITNDQADALVDTAVVRAAGINAAEVAGGCFCCRFDDFVARADELIEAYTPDIILAEPVGSCTDLVATVIKPLETFHCERFTIAPYTVLVDPMRALNLLGGRGGAALSEKIAYIFRMQQQEARGVVVNKLDLLAPDQREEVQRLLRSHIPNARMLEVSARTGEGFGALTAWLEEDAPPSGATPEVDYDTYAAGEAALGWLNSSAEVTAKNPIDVDEVTLDLSRRLADRLRTQQLRIAHAKILARGPHRTAIANIVSEQIGSELSQPSAELAEELDLVINVRAEGTPERLHDVVSDCLDDWAAHYDLELSSGSGQSFSPARPVPTHRMR